MTDGTETLLLTLHARPFPKSHDLLEIFRRLQDGPPIQLDPVGLGILNRYAVEARYPGDWEPITREEAEEAVTLAERVRAEVRRHLPPLPA
jgi:HEPN domain-containing protein